MQSLTAAPRDRLTTSQVTNLLTAPDLEVDFGCDLLDAALHLVDDVTADCSVVTVKRDNLATVHGTVDLTISRELVWGKDRVRPYALLSSPSVGLTGVQFTLGVYLLTTPDMALAETPQSYTVTGFDQLMLLQDCIGDSYSAPAGGNVLALVRALLVSAGIAAPVLLDSSGSAKTLVTARVWPQDSSTSPTWVGVCNDLLASIGYRGLWCDWDGNFRSGPYVEPAGRPPEYTLNVGDPRTGVVCDVRVVSADLWGCPNWARYIRNDMTMSPVEGAGRYTVQNLSTGGSSQASIGRIVRAPVTYLDATSQADLVVQGNRLFGVATRVSEIITIKTSPLPMMWHFDRLLYRDAALGQDRQTQVRSWSLTTDGTDMDIVMETL